MNASADMSIVTLVMNASPVVQCVLAILVIASLASWATIFSKWIVLSRTLRQTDEFEQRFWSGANLTKLLETATSRTNRTSSEERIFVAGMTEFLKLSDKPEAEMLSGVRRGMSAAFQREIDDLERASIVKRKFASRKKKSKRNLRNSRARSFKKPGVLRNKSAP